MGALSVVICAILSSFFLNEKLSFFGWLGCGLCIVSNHHRISAVSAHIAHSTGCLVLACVAYLANHYSLLNAFPIVAGVHYHRAQWTVGRLGRRDQEVREAVHRAGLSGVYWRAVRRSAVHHVLFRTEVRRISTSWGVLPMLIGVPDTAKSRCSGTSWYAV